MNLWHVLRTGYLSILTPVLRFSGGTGICSLGIGSYSLYQQSQISMFDQRFDQPVLCVVGFVMMNPRLLFTLFASGSASAFMVRTTSSSWTFRRAGWRLYSADSAARTKRKLKIAGLAKAIDRGLPNVVTYAPLRDNSTDSFIAGSGLPTKQPFLVLGIESSCDDTGAAVVRSDGTILGEGLAHQNDIHEQWGGVVPGLARDAHVASVDRVVQEALDEAGLNSVADVDAIAVTVGPGLAICLRVGCRKAVHLANEYGKPFVGVHHLEAHILMARLQGSVEFPFLALLVSGGHCQIMECVGIGNYNILGGTLDDSFGEAYDKTARLLGLPIGGGGGPAIEALAKQGDPLAIPLTVPMQSRKDCDFSFAGLKTNVRRAAEKMADDQGLDAPSDLSTTDKANLAASFQHVGIKHVEQRLKRAMESIVGEDLRTLAVVGGVAANQELRRRLQTMCDDRGWTMVVPHPRLCTDQGAMSAWAGVERLLVGSSDAISDEVYARYPFAQPSQDFDDTD